MDSKMFFMWKNHMRHSLLFKAVILNVLMYDWKSSSIKRCNNKLYKQSAENKLSFQNFELKYRWHASEDAGLLGTSNSFALNPTFIKVMLNFVVDSAVVCGVDLHYIIL